MARPFRFALLLVGAGCLSRETAAALVLSDVRARLSWTNGSVVDASPLAQMALGGAPHGRSFGPSYALGRKGTFLYHPKSTDGGDTACQGAVNVIAPAITTTT